jgi:hypothetical protein
MAVAEYHDNANIGLLRRLHAGVRALSKPAVSQIIPVLGRADPDFGDRWQHRVHSLSPI